jgi:hypothetical protein
MKGLRSILPLSRESMRGIEVKPVVGEPPKIEWVNPRDLFVEEDYQRDVGEGGTKMIRGIVGEFSWHMMKPPICFRAPEFGDALVVVDGQHTAIAAATHARIESIPILVFENATAAQRAIAFVGHNVRRVGLTKQALHHAAIAHKEPLALAMQEACEAAGATILTKPIDLSRERPVGETIAIGTIRTTLARHGKDHLIRVMKVLVAAGRGPIKAQEIGAASMVLLRFPRVENIDANLAAAVRSKSAKSWGAIAATLDGSLPQALATCWLRHLDLRAPEASGNGKERPRPPAPPPPQAPKPPAPPPPLPRPSEPPPAPAAKPRAAVFLAQSNGITVTLEGAVARKGWSHTVNLGKLGATLLSRLATVMPAQLGHDRLAQHVFPGKPGARVLLQDLVAACNPDLRKIGLEILEIKTSGYMLRDLHGAAKIGENLPRA